MVYLISYIHMLNTIDTTINYKCIIYINNWSFIFIRACLRARGQEVLRVTLQTTSCLASSQGRCSFIIYTPHIYPACTWGRKPRTTFVFDLREDDLIIAQAIWGMSLCAFRLNYIPQVFACQYPKYWHI